MVTGESEQLVLVASDAGYGFITELNALYSKNRSGKTLLKCPESSQVLPVRSITDLENNQIAVVTNTGYLLIIAAKELPKLPRGKGNKIIQIPSKQLATREEYVVDLVIFSSSKQYA